MRRASLLVVGWLLAGLVGHAHASGPAFRSSSTMGARAVAIGRRHVGAGPPRLASARWRELGIPEAWGRVHPSGLCVAFTSAVLNEAGAPIRRMLYVTELEQGLARAGFRPVWLDDAPQGSVVAIYARSAAHRHPLHFGILEGRRGDTIHMLESGYAPGSLGAPHVLQLASHDGRAWAGYPSRTYFLAPPDSR